MVNGQKIIILTLQLFSLNYLGFYGCLLQSDIWAFLALVRGHFIMGPHYSMPLLLLLTYTDVEQEIKMGPHPGIEEGKEKEAQIGKLSYY